MNRTYLLALIAASPIVLAGCGSAASSSSTHTVTSTVTQTVTTTASAPGGGGTSTGGSSTSSSSAPRCRTSQLGFRFSTDGAAGSIHINGDLTNRSQTTCSLYGYPGLGLLGKSGAALPATVVRSPSVVVPAVAEKLVVLAPGQTARFYAGYSDVDPQPCPSAVRLEVTPPNAYTHLTVPAAIAPCGGIIHVSPVFALAGG
jgi:Domain of unknown function (DUF4232)